MKPHHTIAFLFSLALCSCGGLSTLPKPQGSLYMKSELAGVVMDSKAKTFTNTFDFRIKSSAPSKTYASIRYQSLDGSPDRPPVVKNDLQPGQKVSTSSSAFSRIKRNRSYEVTVQLYSDSTKTHLIDTLKQPVRFSMPANVTNAFGMGDRVD